VTALVLLPKRSLAAPLAALEEAAAGFDERRRSANTVAVYAKAWDAWETWATAHGARAFPASPEAVRLYVVDLARRLRPRSIGVACAAIRARHFDNGLYAPTSAPEVQRVLAGIRRTLGMATRKKRALAVAQLRAMCAAMPDDAQGKRDRAILCLGFAGAFRRAPLCRLDVTDLESHPSGGLLVHIARDKQDQEGKGRSIVVARGENPDTCPVRAIEAWLSVLERDEGPLFVRMRGGRRPSDPEAPRQPAKLGEERLSSASVARVVKARAEAAGLDPSNLAAHSLRSGFYTAAAAAGKKLDRMMAQAGHTKPATAMGYIQDAEMGDDDNASSGIGL
jgi:integrase